jgi:hypothetical protein
LANAASRMVQKRISDTSLRERDVSGTIHGYATARHTGHPVADAGGRRAFDQDKGATGRAGARQAAASELIRSSRGVLPYICR